MNSGGGGGLSFFCHLFLVSKNVNCFSIKQFVEITNTLYNDKKRN